METETKLKQPKAKREANDKIKWVSSIGLLLSILGIIDAGWLTISHYTTAVILACPETAFINCAKVTQSSYSVIHGVPVALLGLGFFVIMFLFQLPATWKSANRYIRPLRVLLSVFGLITVFWLIFVELHKLNSICLYCTAVHILTFGLFITTLIGTSIIPAQSND